MSESHLDTAELPQIIVYNSSESEEIDVDQVADGPNEMNQMFPMINTILRNFQRAGAVLESIQYTAGAVNSDCIITIRSDRPDWSDLVTDVDLETGEGLQRPDWQLLSEQAVSRGLGDSSMTGQELADRATAAGIVVEEGEDGRRIAVSREHGDQP
jgi:hypothetical protein